MKNFECLSMVFAMSIIIPAVAGVLYVFDYSDRQTMEVIIKCTSRFPVDTPEGKLRAFCGKFPD